MISGLIFLTLLGFPASQAGAHSKSSQLSRMDQQWKTRLSFKVGKYIYSATMGFDSKYVFVSFFPSDANLTLPNDVKQMSVKNGNLIHIYKSNSGCTLACSPTQPYLAIASTYSGCQLYNYQDHKLVWTAKPTGVITNAKFSKDGKYLVCNSTILIDVNTGKLLVDKEGKNDPYDALLATTDKFMISYQEIKRQFLARQLPGLNHSRRIPIPIYNRSSDGLGTIVRSIEISDDNKLLVVANQKPKMCRVYSVGTWKQLEEYHLPDVVTGSCMSPDHRDLVLGTHSGLIYIYRLGNPEPIAKLTRFKGQGLIAFIRYYGREICATLAKTGRVVFITRKS